MAEPTEVAKFEPQNFVEKLRDKIRQSMLELIPDEQWNTLLKSEIDGFFNDKTERNAYSSYGHTVPSDFKQAIRRVLSEEINKKVRDMLGSPEWGTYWNGVEQMTGEKLAEFLKENGSLILNQWISGAIQDAISKFRDPNGGTRW